MMVKKSDSDAMRKFTGAVGKEFMKLLDGLGFALVGHDEGPVDGFAWKWSEGYSWRYGGFYVHVGILFPMTVSVNILRGWKRQVTLYFDDNGGKHPYVSPRDCLERTLEALIDRLDGDDLETAGCCLELLKDE